MPMGRSFGLAVTLGQRNASSTAITTAASATPTPTALPTNPVSIGQNQIYLSLGRGALVILGLFALAGLILRVRLY